MLTRTDLDAKCALNLTNADDLIHTQLTVFCILKFLALSTTLLVQPRQ